MNVDGLVVEDRDAVRWITFARPEVRNALNGAVLVGLRDAVVAADADDGIAVVVVRGDGDTFSSGLDLKAMQRGELPPDALRNAIHALRSASVPSIAAVNGPAITAGMGITLACDFAIASDRATFADSHGKIGVISGSGITSLLVERVGSARAKEMSLTARVVDAQTAEQWGLVNAVVPPDQLLPAVVDRTTRIAGHQRNLMRAMGRVHGDLAKVVAEPQFAIEAASSVAWFERDDASANWEKPSLT